MAAGPVFPAFLRLEHQRDGSAKASFLAEVEDTLSGAERRFREFSGEAQRQLDAALSVKRNNVGSLDLGVDEMRAAAAAQQARAVAAREIAQATALAAREEQDYSQKTRMAVAATEALAREEEQAAAKAISHAAALEQVQERLNRNVSGTDMVVQAMRRGTTESSNVINGLRAQRVAFTQLGQQMQDVVVQTQMGTNATTIFVQQVPQMAFALSGLEGNVNRTYNAIGKVATFLSGPWGAAIFAATAVLAPLIAQMFQTGDAAEDAKKKTYDFSNGLSVLTLTANETIAAMQQLQQEMRGAIAVQGDFLRSKALIAGQSVSDIEGRIAQNSATLNGLQRQGNSPSALLPFNGPDYREMGRLQEQIRSDREALKIARQTATDATMAVSQSGVIESLDKRAAATGRYNRAVAELNQTFRKSQANNDPLAPKMSQADYERQFRALTVKRDSELDALKPEKKGPKGPDPVKQAEQLQKFGDSAAESIQRINERFNEQPRLVDAAAQSTRQLDDIIADLEKRKPAGFEKMVADAEAAKGVIQDALVRPYRELARDAERRVEIQKLILAGRDAEANALRDIWQYEDRNGKLTEEQQQRVRDLAEAEERVNDVLRARQEIQNAYLDATRSIRSELENLFSGQSVNFGRIFRQLQSKILVENLFGDIFRDMDKYVRRATGLDAAVDQLVTQGTRAGDALGNFANALDRVSGRVTGAAAPSASSLAAGDPFLAAFDKAFAAHAPANDNTATDEIVVVANRVAQQQESSIIGLTPGSYAELMTKSIAAPLGDLFRELLGRDLALKMGGVLSGAIGGLMTAGPIGAILGGLKGLPGLPEKLAGTLGKAFSGAQTGAVTALVAGGLGLNLSQTGSTIGGALGGAFSSSVTNAIGGTLGKVLGGALPVIGGLLGGLIGNLFGSRPRGSGTVSNTAVTTSANNGGIKANLDSMGLGIQQAVSKVANSLGGTVGNYNVGIGNYKGKWYQVSTNPNDPYLGQAEYSQKSPYDAYDGEDATAALRAAISVAINQGAIQGIRASTQTLLKAGKDIEAQLQKAIDFEGVFTKLRGYTDPVGAALDALDKQFRYLKDTFAEAGASAAEYADLEKLYGIERSKAVKEAMNQVAGSLRSLIDDLTVNNSAYSLRDRERMAQAAYDPLAARVAAGDVTAYEDYSSAARTLTDIKRQIYGSQQGYFDTLTSVTALAQGQLDAQTAIANASSGRDSPFSNSTTSVSNAIDSQTNTLSGQLAAINDNIIALNQKVAPVGLKSASGLGFAGTF